MRTDFRIADTFTASLARLTGDEQKAAKTTAFDLQINPAHPGLSFHKLNGRDKNFCSVRVSADIRLIVHRTEGSLLLCYVDHHDRAYAWAERRKLEVHPKTGAAQLVEIRETIKEITVPRYVDASETALAHKKAKPAPSPRPAQLFLAFTDDELLGYGVPTDWLKYVREVKDEDTLLALIDHLPAEASEALLELATGSSASRCGDSARERGRWVWTEGEPPPPCLKLGSGCLSPPRRFFHFFAGRGEVR